jgi:hypothetical protein
MAHNYSSKLSLHQFAIAEKIDRFSPPAILCWNERVRTDDLEVAAD